MEEIKRRASEWALDAKKGPTHQYFIKDLVEFAKNVIEGEFEPQPADLPQLLPGDPVDALREVMRQELGALVRG